MQKIWNIAVKDVQRTLQDRNLLLIMFVTPIVLSTIIALAFSDIDSSAPIQDLPVALVNLDEGTEDGFNNGQIFVDLLVGDESGSPTDTSDQPDCEAIEGTDDGEAGGMSLNQLTATTLLDDPEAARAGVENGDYVAAIIIPADFSQRVAYQQGVEFEQVAVEVYGDSGRPISASIIRSVAESITSQIASSQIAIASTIDTMVAQAQSNPQFGMAFMTANAAGDFQPNFACAFDPGFNTIGVEMLSVEGGEQEDFNPLVIFGSAQAAFFALFTASGGASAILQERRNWTLQRLLISPTPRVHILLGKMVGVFVTILVQLVFLFLAFTLVGSLLEGELSLIWGSNVPAIVVLVVATSLAAAGVGLVIASMANTSEQASVIGSIIAIFMGAVGGAFFSVDTIPAIDPLTRLSIVRWGSEGFTKLANGDGDVLVNVVALLLIGSALFLFSFVMFNRRQDI
jgi:ABC-2 type transport system permease protein